MERLGPDDVVLCESLVFLNVIRSQVSMKHGDMLECDVANVIFAFLIMHDLNHYACLRAPRQFAYPRVAAPWLTMEPDRF